MSKLISTLNKGFQFQFDNGIFISVQWGCMNYCDHYGEHLEPWYQYGHEMKFEKWDSPNAEICIWDTREDDPSVIGLGKKIITEDMMMIAGIDETKAGTDGNGYDITPEEVAKIMYVCTLMD